MTKNYLNILYLFLSISISNSNPVAASEEISDSVPKKLTTTAAHLPADPSTENQATKSARSVVVYFTNETAYPLVCIGLQVSGGKWLKEPPHTPGSGRDVPAFDWVDWASVSKGIMTGTEGNAVYDCPDTFTFYRFHWSSPWSGDPWCTVESIQYLDYPQPANNIPINGEKSKRYLVKTISGNDTDNYVIYCTLESTAKFMKDKFLELKAKEAETSAVIYLHNNSPVDLTLVNADLVTNNNPTITQSDWIQKPPHTIPSAGWAVWVSRNKNLQSLAGEVKYSYQTPVFDELEPITDVLIDWVVKGGNASDTLGNATRSDDSTPSVILLQ